MQKPITTGKPSQVYQSANPSTPQKPTPKNKRLTCVLAKTFLIHSIARNIPKNVQDNTMNTIITKTKASHIAQIHNRAMISKKKRMIGIICSPFNGKCE